MYRDGIQLYHTADIRVRYADTDKMGIVYNGNYAVFFEIGRTELMRHYGILYRDFEKNGFLLPVIEMHINYRNPAYYDDLLRVKTSLMPEHKPVLKFIYNIFRDNTTIVEGYTIHGFLNAVTRKPVKPPRIFIDAVNSCKI